MEGDKVVTPEAAIRIGSFANVMIDFIIVTSATFMVVKRMNVAKKKEGAAFAAPPKDQELLT